jgi:hypothetical protein
MIVVLPRFQLDSKFWNDASLPLPNIISPSVLWVLDAVGASRMFNKMISGSILLS